MCAMINENVIERSILNFTKFQTRDIANIFARHFSHNCRRDSIKLQGNFLSRQYGAYSRFE